MFWRELKKLWFVKWSVTKSASSMPLLDAAVLKRKGKIKERVQHPHLQSQDDDEFFWRELPSNISLRSQALSYFVNPNRYSNLWAHQSCASEVCELSGILNNSHCFWMKSWPTSQVADSTLQPRHAKRSGNPSWVNVITSTNVLESILWI